MQGKQTPNSMELTELSRLGRIVSLDPGTKRIGVAVTDVDQTIATPQPRIERTSWKHLLSSVKVILTEFDAAALVIGLPLESDGSDGPMTSEARDMARKFALSLDIPVFLQDERLSSYEAKSRMWEQGLSLDDARKNVDSEAASIILSDFLDRLTTLRH